MALPEGTVTFLRSDIEGSMDLVRALGARYDELNAEHQTLVRDIVSAQSGQVVRTEGDAFFVVFTDAGLALRAAVAIQESMGAHPWPDGHLLKLRIGVHSGSAIRAGDDYGGFEVNRAARIAAMGWGGQIILSDAVRALVSAQLADEWTISELGRYRLKGVLEPERIFQLNAPGLASAFPELRSPSTATQHLPTRLTSLIGREDDLDALSRLLPTTRLLTLTGPGGTGKTTLAVELARRHAEELADGAWFIDLQSVHEPDQVKAEIAHGLDMYDGAAGAAVDSLGEFIADRELLLVIDNFEQVIDAARVVGELLEASPGSRFIVTSRTPLRLAAEQEYGVRPLELSGAPSGDEAAAVRLFVERVRRVRPTHTFDAQELEASAEICRLLDGLPLAIELTAARAASLPLHLIRDRLSQRLPLPGSGPRDLPERQRTVEDTVAWSYDLLDEPLQHLAHRLAIFVDSFDLEQAEAVAGPISEIGIDVLDGLYQLVEHSFIHRVDDAIGGVRFGMLETVRVLTLRRLRETGEELAMQLRHAQAFASLADEAASHIPGPEQGHWLDRLDPDDANLRAAANWAISADHFELAVGCAARPWRFWLVAGRLTEASELIRRTLSMEGAAAPTAARLRALDAAGSAAYWAGDLEAALLMYGEELALAEELDDELGRAMALLNMSFALALQDKDEAAHRARREAASIFERHGDEESLLMLEWSEMLVASMWDDSDARAKAADALASRLEALGSGWHTAMALATRMQAALIIGDVLSAGSMGIRALRLALDTRDFGPATFGIEALGAGLASAGDQEGAAVTLGAIRRTWLRYGIRPPRPFWELSDSPDPMLAIEDALGAERLAAATARGEAMTDEALVDFLESAFERLHSEAPVPDSTS
jgi:predicted ATPase/class 3 adenylate cyclase